MTEIEARVHMATPSRFLEEIARHWAKRYPTRYDPLTAEHLDRVAVREGALSYDWQER